KDYAEAVASVLEQRPHVVLFVGGDEVTKAFLQPIEGRWPEPKYRPFYLSADSFGGNVEMLRWVSRRAELRRRFFQAAFPSNSPANVRFTGRYNEPFSEKVTADLSPAAPYDAFYVLAYALAALGEEPIDGLRVARAVRRLLPPGASVEVGPSNIFDALAS